MKHRRTRLSLGIKIVSILSCFALLSAGFAAWWIVKTPSVPLNDGSFTVYDVTQKEITVSTPTFTNSTIVFGKPASPTVATKWLVAKDETGAPMATDVLTATLSFTVGIKDDTETNLSDLVTGITITFAPNDATKTALGTAIAGTGEKSYIAAPVIQVDGTTVATYSHVAGEMVATIPATDTNTMNVSVTIKFDWGTLTEGKNPFDYYNGLDYTTELAGQAFNMLDAIAALKSGGYNITIGATLPSA